MRARPGILFSFAHPDDESFLAAGTACRYGAAGARLGLVCATRGGAGKAGDPPVCNRAELPAVRERELRAAAEILGIDDVTLLDHPDRELGAAPIDAIRATLVGVIRRVRPAVVVTFDPNGTNQHPDHVAISRFTTDAIAAAADPRWFPEAGPAHEVPRLIWSPPVPPWSNPEWRSMTNPPAGIDFVLDVHEYWERKAAALRAHRTQHIQIDRFFFGDVDTRTALGVETFRQGWGPTLPHRPVHDLFAGL
jgi:N-acetylglucosamine malate deacetylase 2